ncbi:MAG TPA: OmpA family protein, partial [Geminicoccaceae bacterium]|nr:OmpA family protein [Geminicoccaceae bacterium]
MKANGRLLTLAALCLATAACSAVQPTGSINPNIFDDVDLRTTDIDAAWAMAPQGATFSQGLRTGYFDLADQQEAQLDLPDRGHFTRKAVASAKGINVQPDMVALRRLPEDRVGEFEAARARLLSGLDRGGRLKAGPAAARAQVSYDCWLEETAAGNEEAANAGRRAFEDAMREVETALATGAGNEYVVFFAWDSTELTPVTLQVIEQVAADYKAGRVACVLVAGHADRSGSEAYNLGLSERRARVAA